MGGPGSSPGRRDMAVTCTAAGLEQKQRGEDMNLCHWNAISRNRDNFLLSYPQCQEEYLAHSRCLLLSECLCPPRIQMQTSYAPEGDGI